jgi:hypothetical protein
MAKTLKVSFAMGGGVSLGSFSGAALTETLKLLILYGQDDEGCPYDAIILDSFSGASAGAISLGILMRGLMDYESILEILKYSKQDIHLRLEKAYSAEKISHLDLEKLEQLYAAETCQLLQKKLWVKEISLEALMNSGEKDRSKKSKNSLLEQDYMINGTVDYLLNGVNQWNKDNIKAKKRLLAKDRVLFACSLTNVASISRTKSPNEDPIIKSFERSNNDYDHKELRVVDFQFEKGLSGVDKWLSLSVDPEAADPDHPTPFSLFSVESWAMFAASAIACGAFPIAFEPAILERYKREMELTDEVKNIGGSEEPLKFAYIDGGTFNNEPIAEAFKMAYYLDFEAEQEEAEYDRIVFFVDPIVSLSDPDYNIPFFQKYKARYASKKKGFRLKRVTTRQPLDNIFSYSTKLIEVMRREGAVKEGVKIKRFLDLYAQREAMMPSYTNLVAPVDEKHFAYILYVILWHINKEIEGEQIPPGTSQKAEFFAVKYRQILKKYYNQILSEKEKEDLLFILNGLDQHFLSIINDEYINELKQVRHEAEVAKMNNFCMQVAEEKKIQAQENPEQISMYDTEENQIPVVMNKLTDFFIPQQASSLSSGGSTSSSRGVKQNKRIEAVSLLLADVLSGTIDKDIHAYLVAITPMNFHTEGNNDNLKTTKLPGVEFEAFAGFTSEASREIAFKQGRLCSIGILESGAFRQQRKRDMNKGELDIKVAPLINKNAVQAYKSYLKTDIRKALLDNPQYWSKYQNLLFNGLKLLGLERIVFFLEGFIRLRNIYILILLPVLSVLILILLPILTVGFIRFIADYFLLRKSLKKSIEYESGHELLLEVSSPEIKGRRGYCTFINQKGQRIGKTKIKIDQNSQKAFITLPYVWRDDVIDEDKNATKEPIFYHTRYQKKMVEGLELRPDLVIEKLHIFCKPLISIRPTLVKTIHLASFKDIDIQAVSKLRYFINPLLRADANNNVELIDDVLPLRKEILNRYNEKYAKTAQAASDKS